MHTEHKDRQLFDRIAREYTKKDLYPVSRMARRFQLLSLIDVICQKQFNHILDLGCGSGFNVRYLNGRYVKYTGIDYSENFIRIARDFHPGQNFLHCNIKEVEKIYNDPFDLILGIGVLHHIDDLDAAFRGIKKACSQNTILAFLEPYRGNPFIQLLRNIRKRTDKSYNDNQLFFSRKELERIFKANGFRILSVRYQGYFSPPFAQIILKPAIIFYPLCWMAINIDVFIQKYLNNPLSWNIQIVAKQDVGEETGL